MSKIIVSLSERDIRDLELGNKLWTPVNPNLDRSNLQGVVIRKDSANIIEEDDSLNKHSLL